MKKIHYLVLAFATITALSCTKDFDNMRKDPNSIKDITPGTLLSQTLYTATTTNIAAARSIGNELMQYTVQKSENAFVQRYDIRATEGNNLWNKHYTMLNNAQDMLIRAEKEGNANYTAVALTLKAWMMSELTDAFGNVPYSEALKGDELDFLPKYDKQQDIYEDLLGNLDKAALLFNDKERLDQGGDILYGTREAAQVTCWKKFCNSLRLRLYLRVSNRPEMNSPAKINSIVSNPDVYPIFTGASDQAYLAFTNTEPFYNPYFNLTNVDFGANYCPSNFILQMMQDFGDPRIPIWYNKNGLEYVSTQSGFPSGMAGTIFSLPTSYINYTLHESPRLGMIMSYSELQFILAEVALKGWIPGGNAQAQIYYENGVRASMTFWVATLPATYLTQPGVAFDGNLSTIINQKYLSLFYVGLESWFDYRRTGYPALIVHPQASNGGKMPRRLLYPIVTQAYNKTNYLEAVSWIGTDNINVKSWWEQ
ncbi:Starch-binding associating with outer membrane [compost metagenome]